MFATTGTGGRATSHYDKRGKTPESLPKEEIPPEIRQFIQSTINSVDQLEVLLFLMSNADRGRTVEEISSRIRVTPTAISSKLKDLCGAGLLSSRDEGPDGTYRYAPETTALAAELVDSLNRAYRESRDSVIQLIYTRPLDNIRIFADAFRISKEER